MRARSRARRGPAIGRSGERKSREPDPRMSEFLRIGNLSFEVRRSRPRTPLGLTVDRSSELIVHAPTEADESELLRWTRRKLLWVHRKLAIKDGVGRARRGPEFVSGETFFYLGRSYRLQVRDQQAE